MIIHMPRNTQHARVIAVMAAPEEEVKRLISAYGMEFPVQRIEESLINRLVMAFPTVVEVEDGIVRNKLEGALPTHLLTRLRQLNREQVRVF
jgi:hypothetical protein